MKRLFWSSAGLVGVKNSDGDGACHMRHLYAMTVREMARAFSDSRAKMGVGLAKV